MLKEEGSSATDSVTDVTDVTDVKDRRKKEEGRRKRKNFPNSSPLPLTHSPTLFFLHSPPFPTLADGCA
jgi:hypothetical protein